MDRFFSKVEKKDGCWNWTATVSRNGGYGMFYLAGKMRIASRVSWELHSGEIPNGLCVLHRCDNPKCVNPNHLFLGTHKDNSIDMIKKGRGTILSLRFQGETHPRAKLTNAEVKRIRELFELGELQRNLAEMFGVKQKQISRIVRKESRTSP